MVALDSNTGQTRSRLNLDNSTFARTLGVYEGAFIVHSFVKDGDAIAGHEISARTDTKTLWTFRTPKNSDLGISTAKNGVVFIPILVDPTSELRKYEFTALDAKTGKVMWVWKTSTKPKTLVIENRVYASTYSEDRFGKKPGWVKSFDLQTGRELWTHRMLGGMTMVANDREVFIHDSAIVDAPRTRDKSKTRLVVVDIQTGKQLRQIDLPLKHPQGINTITLGNNVIYTSDAKIENVTSGSNPSAENHSWANAFDASNGKLLWRTLTLRHSQISSLKVRGNRLFVASQGLKNEVKSTVQSFPDR